MRLWVQAYAPAKRSLVEFKNSMLRPKELKHKNKIRAVLDHQLVNLRTYNIDPRAPSHDLAGLRSTYNFETVGNSTKLDEISLTVNDWHR